MGEVAQELEAVLAGDIGKKEEALPTITIGADRFGTEQRKAKAPQQAGENRSSKETAKT